MPRRSLPDLPPPARAPHRQSISSTAATVADNDTESLAAKGSFSQEQDDSPSRAVSVHCVFADPVESVAALPKTIAVPREVQSARDQTGSRSAVHGSREHSEQPDATSESMVRTATANGSNLDAATSAPSNDMDPFAETDAALHSNAESEVLVSPIALLQSLHLGMFSAMWHEHVLCICS